MRGSVGLLLEEMAGTLTADQGFGDPGPIFGLEFGTARLRTTDHILGHVCRIVMVGDMTYQPHVRQIALPNATFLNRRLVTKNGSHAIYSINNLPLRNDECDETSNG